MSLGGREDGTGSAAANGSISAPVGIPKVEGGCDEAMKGYPFGKPFEVRQVTVFWVWGEGGGDESQDVLLIFFGFYTFWKVGLFVQE